MGVEATIVVTSYSSCLSKALPPNTVKYGFEDQICNTWTRGVPPKSQQIQNDRLLLLSVFVWVFSPEPQLCRCWSQQRLTNDFCLSAGLYLSVSATLSTAAAQRWPLSVSVSSSAHHMHAKLSGVYSTSVPFLPAGYRQALWTWKWGWQCGHTLDPAWTFSKPPPIWSTCLGFSGQKVGTLYKVPDVLNKVIVI